MISCLIMANWGFLTNHARVLLCIAHDPGARLRDIAASLGITERSAYGIVADLAEARYVIKQKDGRRNRYQIQAAAAAGGCQPGTCHRRNPRRPGRPPARGCS
jgi:DNA-binding IclR family transcriptional regulator